MLTRALLALTLVAGPWAALAVTHTAAQDARGPQRLPSVGGGISTAWDEQLPRAIPRHGAAAVGPPHRIAQHAPLGATEPYAASGALPPSAGGGALSAPPAPAAPWYTSDSYDVPSPAMPRLSGHFDPLTENPDLFVPQPPASGYEYFAPPGDDCLSEEPADVLPGARAGLWQRSTLVGTWLAPGGGDDLGISDWSTTTTLGLPFPTRDKPLLLTPGFTAMYLDGPATRELPPRLYTATLDLLTIRPLSPRWMLHLGVTPGVFSDFERSDSETIRVQGRALGFWQWSETTRVVLGVVYLDRDDVNLLPAAGLIWTPNEATQYELIFPRPRFSRRLTWTPHAEWWSYLAGEFGGGTWAFRRDDGVGDIVTYGDLRLLLGLERRYSPQTCARFEVGYVFAREIELASGPPNIEPGGTLLLRLGLTL